MIYFLIPTYNEQDNIDRLIDLLEDTIKNEERFYVFSDDGSKDSTIKVIKEKIKHNNYVVLGNGENNGPGYAFNKGFEWILVDSKSPEDKIITLEADCTSDLNILPEMLMLSKMKYDLVLASVYAQGGGFEKTSFFRKLLSFLANMMFRLFFDIKVLTLSSFYRIYRVELIKKIQNKHMTVISEKGFISMIEILIKSITSEAKIIEVPMKLYSTKRKGKSKMKILNTTISYLRFLIKYKLKNK